jgi:hypothetical protein
MPTAPPLVASCLSVPTLHASDALLAECAGLFARIWPAAGGTAAQPSSWLAELVSAPPGMRDDEWLHVGCSPEGRPVSAALSFWRRIRLGARERWVLALRRVATYAAHRGVGQGSRAVRAALARLTPERDVCLFQTDIPVFYERIGARRIDNQVSTSVGGYAFRSAAAMILPGTAPWTPEAIDLCGPGW